MVFEVLPRPDQGCIWDQRSQGRQAIQAARWRGRSGPPDIVAVGSQ